MPKEAARLWVRVLGLKIERVQDISEEDALAEGVGYGWQMNAGWPDYQHIVNGACEVTQDTAQMSFATLWDSIYAPRGLGWAENPWVEVPTFEVVK